MSIAQTQEADRLLRRAGLWRYTTDAIDRRERIHQQHIARALYTAPEPELAWTECDAECLRDVCLALDMPIETAMAMQYRSVGWTVAQIAELVGQPASTASYRIRHAIRVFAELAAVDADPPRCERSEMWGWWIVRCECCLCDMRSWWPEFADKVAASRSKPRW